MEPLHLRFLLPQTLDLHRHQHRNFSPPNPPKLPTEVPNFSQLSYHCFDLDDSNFFSSKKVHKNSNFYQDTYEGLYNLSALGHPIMVSKHWLRDVDPQ